MPAQKYQRGEGGAPPQTVVSAAELEDWPSEIEASIILGVAVADVRDMIGAGRLRWHNRSFNVAVHPADVAAVAAQRNRPPAAG